ncbi:DUF3829 domain-containing protein [Sphingomonas sp. DG1-23]|uniref:DUF3829 domain-containing protein n=1 Tax=Sphingomonas sp. DG1-23 TaxID=3068316 RepID=UPI00273DC220|nr:DUF3829 domain-containing protein [Sphingomonas sp. DG1-23]MDP5280780.1 DUF3829 domain-containing protein [Sphingomonas sp. DG1-23]
MRRVKLRQGAALAGLLMLGACGGAGAGGAGNGSAEVAATPATAAKLSAYTEAYNALIDTFGLPRTATEYKEERVASRSPADDISISQGWIETAHGKLKAARALPGALGPLDAAAGTLDTALEKLMARLGPLYSYYNTKAYRQDALKRGKAEDAQMTAEFDAALKAMDDFNTALVQQRRAGTDAELAQLKADGDTVGYNNKQAMRQAEDLVALFDKPEDLKDPAVFAKGDALAGSLEKLLAEQQKALAAAKAKATEPIEKSRLGVYGLVGDMLGTMIGQYRQLKQSHSGNDAQSMVDSYNRAVGMGMM